MSGPRQLSQTHRRAQPCPAAKLVAPRGQPRQERAKHHMAVRGEGKKKSSRNTPANTSVGEGWGGGGSRQQSRDPSSLLET